MSWLLCTSSPRPLQVWQVKLHVVVYPFEQTFPSVLNQVGDDKWKAAILEFCGLVCRERASPTCKWSYTVYLFILGYWNVTSMPCFSDRHSVSTECRKRDSVPVYSLPHFNMSQITYLTNEFVSYLLFSDCTAKLKWINLDMTCTWLQLFKQKLKCWNLHRVSFSWGDWSNMVLTSIVLPGRKRHKSNTLILTVSQVGGFHHSPVSCCAAMWFPSLTVCYPAPCASGFEVEFHEGLI